MPVYEGTADGINVVAVREDTGEAVRYDLSSMVDELESGEIVPALAADLDISGSSNVDYTQTAWVETTGGDQDINSGKQARVVSVRGTTDGIAASGAKIVSVGFNQLAPSGISGQTATFIAVKSAWGSYGTSSENNGYLFTDSEGNIVVPSSVTQSGSAVPTHTESGVVYYLPSANGEVVATFASGVDVSKICAHICWSNYRDTDYEEYTASELSLASVITSIGGTMRRIDGTGGYVYDEITFGDTAAERVWCRRVDVLTLASLSWSVEEQTSGESTSYLFKAAVSGAKSGGLITEKDCSLSGFYLDGTTLCLETTLYSTTAQLITALGSSTLWYELATAVSGSHSLTGLMDVDDFGTIRFEGGAEVVDFDMEYATYWRDVLKNMPTTIENEGKTAAEAISEVESRVQAIEKNLTNGLPHLKVESLEVVRSLVGWLIDDGDTENALILARTAAPSSIPAFVGQVWVDTSAKVVYMAAGNSAVTDWKQISNV